MMSDMSAGMPLAARAGASRAICGPFTSARIPAESSKTEQVVSIVDQHVELVQKIFAEDTAKVEIDGIGVLDVKHDYLLVGHRMGANFEHVELRDGSGCIKSDSCYRGRAQSIQMELSGQRGIDHRGLAAGIQQESCRGRNGSRIPPRSSGGGL
jgi:hypothetical protein